MNRVTPGRLGRAANAIGGALLGVAIAFVALAPWQVVLLDRLYAVAFLGFMALSPFVIWQARRKTVVFVTHSIDEALMLSDRIVLLAPNPGRIKRIFEVPMPRPRSRTEPAFNALYDEIWSELSS